MNTQSIWTQRVEQHAYPALDRDLSVDVLIIGGGITGATCAKLLAVTGQKVALLERDRLGSGDTSHTTAHLTYMTDTRLSEIVKACGEEAAAAGWNAGRAAIETIRELARASSDDFEFREVPGYLVAAGGDVEEERGRLRDEAALAEKLGFDAGFVETDPITGLPCILFARQAKFHPLKFIQAMAKDATFAGVRIFENTKVTEFGNEPLHVMANGHRVTYEKVIIATHVPMQGNRKTIAATAFQTKLASYSTYAIAARVPKAGLIELIWSNTADPFDYLRVDFTDGEAVVIFGGEDHKTGQTTETRERFSNLEDRLAGLVAGAEVTNHWSGQVVETVDGLPYIGEVIPGQFIATGFSGNGMTFGVASALMARDWVEAKSNPWRKALDPMRVHLSTAFDYLKENKDFPWRLVKDRFAIPEGNVTEVGMGEGRVMKSDGGHVAICRDQKGNFHKVSAVCPHLGCIVAWNEAEATWDCPCHGSRFAPDGTVIAGPAQKNLEPINT